MYHVLTTRPNPYGAPSWGGSCIINTANATSVHHFNSKPVSEKKQTNIALCCHGFISFDTLLHCVFSFSCVMTLLHRIHYKTLFQHYFALCNYIYQSRLQRSFIKKNKWCSFPINYLMMFISNHWTYLPMLLFVFRTLSKI